MIYLNGVKIDGAWLEEMHLQPPGVIQDTIQKRAENAHQNYAQVLQGQIAAGLGVPGLLLPVDGSNFSAASVTVNSSQFAVSIEEILRNARKLVRAAAELRALDRLGADLEHQARLANLAQRDEPMAVNYDFAGNLMDAIDRGQTQSGRWSDVLRHYGLLM